MKEILDSINDSIEQVERAQYEMRCGDLFDVRIYLQKARASLKELKTETEKLVQAVEKAGVILEVDV